MKFALLFLCLFVGLTVHAQQINHSDLNSIKKFEKQYTTYVSKDNIVFNVGDRIKIGRPSSVAQTFMYITEQDALTGTASLPAGYSGFETEIKRIRVGGNKRIGYAVMFWTKGIWGPSTFVINIENALATGEIRSSVMTSDEALAELKRAKDKLDLGLITQQEFEKLKAELAPIIK
ncbi:MAG: SHOCT domain-containing protein [Cyclobacteriaceae bacterium]|nr:SHOCT domain-containing protein [Cyclobacteriaceae bacterium]